jgi:hypothetical protein
MNRRTFFRSMLAAAATVVARAYAPAAEKLLAVFDVRRWTAADIVMKDHGMQMVGDGTGENFRGAYRAYMTQFSAGPFEAWSLTDAALVDLVGTEFRAASDMAVRDRFIQQLSL